ncbi:ribonuclease M5 [Pseudalkalibacillus berkeleyi]|uniref:Ribonuclease M5 n=1 Tax=Pseudalkalibacillus berkeleyi TaxID=1069813 RepID=A0ABS9H708_9BACL|nr:ribonuclease M5 [Pseudalkalibacillus berkeleyi]MCF6139580.1 ribonuclease M5 [Pseudalkalibacillus berkeleyi]
MKIKEIIVVEGKSDTIAVKRALDADTIETNGSEISASTIERIRLAQERRGVIVFTDPDYPGERIRRIIRESVPGCKHAFLPKLEAIALNNKGLGIEHASDESIQNALQSARKDATDEETELISWQDLVNAGLVGGSDAKARREKLGLYLKLGYSNGKQLHKRLKMFRISRDEFRSALQRVLKEEES